MENVELTTKKQQNIERLRQQGFGNHPENINKNGKPPGTLSFSTKWKKFIEHIAEQNKTTVDKVDQELLDVAYKQMKSGSFQYWKDIQDRVYGQAKGNLDVTSEGKPLQLIIKDGSRDQDNSTPQVSE